MVKITSIHCIRNAFHLAFPPISYAYNLLFFRDEREREQISVTHNLFELVQRDYGLFAQKFFPLFKIDVQ